MKTIHATTIQITFLNYPLFCKVILCPVPINAVPHRLPLLLNFIKMEQ